MASKLQFTAVNPSRRDAVRTRQKLLDAAFEEIYRTGFQGSDLMSIINRAGVTKGALYHHFGSKEGLGLAVIDAIIVPRLRDRWVTPLESAEDPVAEMIGIVEATSLETADVSGGSALGNLAHEMSPLDEGFRKRLARAYGDWIGSIAVALKRGKVEGRVRGDVRVHEFATLFVATYEGFVGLAKAAQDADMMTAGVSQMKRMLEDLRPHS